MVLTGTYQYVPVQDGTGQYKNSQLVHTSMYQYILVLRTSHGVSIPELKMSTNLKMHLKPSVQDVWQNLDSGSTL